MIIQNFIPLFNLFYLSSLLLLFFIINKFFFESNVRRKFFIFLVIFLIFMGIGLYYSLDGIIMLFVISELSVLMIFITMFSQLYSFNSKESKVKINFIFILLIILNYSYFDVKILSYNNFYSYYNINLNDFYYIYNYYFEKQILVTILVIFIITLYSIFFILLYFTIKKKQNFEHSKVKQISLLRKQNILRQSNYFTQIRTFQKK